MPLNFNLVLLWLFAILNVHAFNASLPNVTVIATGGTIAGVANDSTATTGYKDASLAVDVLLRSVPFLSTIANVDGIQYSSVGSENVNSSLLVGLSVLVNTLARNTSVSGIVITHGTDTLEETAMFLDLTYNASIPVVVVGSMRPATALSADGPYNILEAVGLAASAASRDRSVLIAFNDRIGTALYTTKTNTRALDTFRAVEQGYLGVFLDSEPVFYASPARAPGKPYFTVQNGTTLPKVPVLYGHQDMDVGLLEAAAAGGAAGVVVACTGDGTLPATWIDEAGNLTQEGVPVVRASRTGTSFVSPKEGAAIGSGNYNPQKARLLLQLILNEHGGDDINLIKSYFYP
ncbi:Asparaginase-like protein 2 [Elsinoe fawcettii]|nr:Asparaginase-like protein 2 [Elsinoe fawcettii]